MKASPQPTVSTASTAKPGTETASSRREEIGAGRRLSSPRMRSGRRARATATAASVSATSPARSASSSRADLHDVRRARPSPGRPSRMRAGSRQKPRRKFTSVETRTPLRSARARWHGAARRRRRASRASSVPTCRMREAAIRSSGNSVRREVRVGAVLPVEEEVRLAARGLRDDGERGIVRGGADDGVDRDAVPPPAPKRRRCRRPPSRPW